MTAPPPANARQLARIQRGARAEDMACDHLRGLGFEIIGRNIRVGRLELDVIARRGRLVVFCEVRSRTSDWLMTPAQTIDPGKVQRIRSAAAQWLRDAKLGPVQVRFDVASVTFDVPGGRLNHLEGAF
ncbi:MAG TPA: YraN family protein [Polyangiales bacterium]|nr:YraN family protein [Polyangiales bacterium]